MKSYIQGMITGGVFVFAFMVLIGSQKKFISEEKAQEIRDPLAIREKLEKSGVYRSETGTYQITSDKIGRALMIDTSTGMIWDWSPFGHWEPMITK